LNSLTYINYNIILYFFSSIFSFFVYTLGEFKDDQIQEHTHLWQGWNGVGSGDKQAKSRDLFQQDPKDQGTLGILSGRSGTTTHGKQLGVNYIIKY
jgi:hypothetical protein